MNGHGIRLDGPHDGRNLAGNLLRHGSIITDRLHDATEEPECLSVAADMLSETIPWGDLPAGSELPPTPHRSCSSPFWTGDLPWPPFGPDVSGPGAGPRRPAAARKALTVAARPRCDGRPRSPTVP